MNPPANSPTTTPGATVMAASIATAEADASSVRIAMTGSAVRVMRLPSALTACAAHSRMQSGFCRRPSPGLVVSVMPENQP